jgi:3-hydroxyacyl-[acyl-carrier-protein] dehydratase
MRFRLTDRILEIQPGARIKAEKRLRPEEDYLRDHFPQFPVMPGVLMLEALFQTSMWLVRRTDEFAFGVVILKEARNIKYADFVQPGQVLVLTAEYFKQDNRLVTLKVEGQVNGSVAVSGRLVLERFNQADKNPEYAPVDKRIRMFMKSEFERLCQATA